MNTMEVQATRAARFDAAAQYGVVPVLRIPRPELAVPLVGALCAGGLPLIEVTLRNESALESIRLIRQAFPDLPVSAGTVLSCEQADAAVEAGADFVVTPGFRARVVEHCVGAGIPILPGCVTATEIEAGREMGLSVFKFFPAEQLGGVRTICELCGPYADIRFVATSGITLKNLPAYMACRFVSAAGGSFMAPAELVEAENWAAISALCREAVRISLGFRLMHIGVNGADAAEGAAIARRFAELFGLPYLPGGRSDFAGDMLESCKTPFPGAKGHIAIGTHSIARAVANLEARGIRFREAFRNVDAAGRLKAIYLEEEVGGFAVHLLQSN